MNGDFGALIYVCENPNVVAIAADELGPRCASLVCTEGMPAAAQRTLLTQLASAGARLFYHGDFDWAGLRIGNFVMRTWPALPWRFTASDYEMAASRAPQMVRDLSDAPVVAAWDVSLTAAMQNRGVAVAEEAVVTTCSMTWHCLDKLGHSLARQDARARHRKDIGATRRREPERPLTFFS